MSDATTGPSVRKPLRLWPGVLFAVVLVLGRYVIPPIAPDAELFSLPLGLLAIFTGMFAAAGIVVWWVFFSRAPWIERPAAVILIALAVAVLMPIVHVSIRTGNMGYMLYFYAVPILTLGLVVWAVATCRLSDGMRRTLLPIALALAALPFVLLRTAGVSGGGAELHWRWTPTPEDRLLAQAPEEPKPPASPQEAAIPAAPEASARPAETARVDKPLDPPRSEGVAPPPPSTGKPEPAAAIVGPAEWPGFRGPRRDGIVRGVRINTDWTTSPPVEIWRRPIGPGWSSFAVDGDLVYTQEQRGEHEFVSCYRLTTGQPVWTHRDAIRFWESNAGAGPRGTPAVHNGRVYAMGATGVLNALNARTGARLWSRQTPVDADVKVPDWGIASSPLVIDDVVIVAVSGRLVAYDAATGNRRWLGPSGGSGYSSPHLLTIDGVPQVLLLRGSRTISLAPADGTLLWEHVWEPGVGFVQPAVTPDGDVLITVGDAMGGLGIRRLAVRRGPSGWTAQERWTSRGLKPYFNDYVVHNGHAFGFDGSILACINLENGERRWKGGRYGQGQLVLLADQDLLLVMSEEGELALVKATPDEFRQVARFKAIEGKTWNHPVLVGDRLLVRNGEEMAAFRLPRVSP